MIKELWIPVKGHEQGYEVSNYGKVRSLPRMIKHNKGGLRMWKGGIVRPDIGKNGYYRIMFGDRKRQLLHRIVAIAFIPNPKNKPCINHIDGNPANNRVSNLEWVTHSENEKHSFSKLGKKATAYWVGIKSEDNPSSKRIAKVVSGKIVEMFASGFVASDKLGWSPSFIRDASRGNPKPHLDFKLKYISKKKFESLKETIPHHI